MVLISFLDYKVLENFIKRVAPTVVTRISPLASCLVGSKDPTACGCKLESQRKEKYVTSI